MGRFYPESCQGRVRLNRSGRDGERGFGDAGRLYNRRLQNRHGYRFGTRLVRLTQGRHREVFGLNINPRIACQDDFPQKGFDMKTRPKPRIRSVDYHLEFCMEARLSKMRISGREETGGANNTYYCSSLYRAGNR
jgi:hypothetical protein